MQFATVEELKHRLELTALARGMDADHSVIVTLNNADTNNQPIRFIVGYAEPTSLDIPLNILWYVRNPASSFYGHIVRRNSRSPSTPYKCTWVIQTNLGLIMTTPQVWDQPVPAYQDLYDHATEVGDPHSTAISGIGAAGTEATMTEPLYLRNLANYGDDYAANEAVPRSWVELSLDAIRNVTENIIQSFANINAQIDNLRTRVEILERSLLGVRGYLYETATALSTWNIAHNLNNTKVVVQVYEADEVVLPASIKVISAQQVRVTFAAPVAGRAQIIPVVQLG